MNRATRDKVVSRTDESDVTTGNACWETAPLVFEKLNDDFGPFDIDLTGDAQRALCPVWLGPNSPFGPDGYDVLTANGLGLEYGVDWSSFMAENGYSNPPYGRFIRTMLELSRNHALFCGFTTTLLLPLRVTGPFKEFVLTGASDLLFCDRRLVFFESGAPRINKTIWDKKHKAVADTAIFDSIIVRYVPGVKATAAPRVGIWEVPNHVTKTDLLRAQEGIGA